MALGGQIIHPIGFYVEFRVCKYLRYVYVYIYMYIWCIYVRWEPCTPPLRFLLKCSIYIYVITTIYTCIISLDAEFDEDSDSKLQLELGAHPQLVFE